jgi:methyl-accepting chemotaxis protein
VPSGVILFRVVTVLGMVDPHTKMLSDIAVKVGQLEAHQAANAAAIGAMAASVNRLVDKLDKSDDVARSAYDRAQSAHHRINELKTDVDEIKKGQSWLPKMIASSVISTIIGGVVGVGIAQMIGG